MLAATLKDDRTTLTHWTEIQTDSYLDSIVQTTGRQLMPTASCFNFFPPHKKILLPAHIGTFGFAPNRTSQRRGKTKRANFANAPFKFPIFTT